MPTAFTADQLSEHAVLSSQAIQRLEAYTFSLVKIIITSGVASLEDLEEARKDLMGYDDLQEYWKSDKT